jgi:hypothetical protein
MEGFTPEDKMTSEKKKFRDIYVWFLNMASLYEDCCAENTFNKLDFSAHYFLQKRKIKKWSIKFTHDPVIWDDAKEMEEAARNGGLSPNVYWACKWFLNGLNGPFGNVSLYSHDLIATILKNDNVATTVSSNQIKNNLLPNKNSISFVQDDIVNCGVCCLLFMYNLVTTQHNVSWRIPMNKDGTLPDSIVFGTSTFGLKGSVMQEQLNLIYRLVREDIVMLMERLWFLYLESCFGMANIETNVQWGVPPEGMHIPREKNVEFSNQTYGKWKKIGII